MNFDQIKQTIIDTGFATIRVTIAGEHKYIKFNCPYTAISQGVNWMDRGYNPVQV